MLVREPCSFFVYHCDVKRANPGVTADSVTSNAISLLIRYIQSSQYIPPSMKRTATPPAKSFTAAKVHRVIPHRIMLTAEYFPSGNRCNSLFVGYSKVMYPK
jgi:hypothetical protein